MREVNRTAVMPFGRVGVIWRGGRVERVVLGDCDGPRDHLLEKKLSAVLKTGRIPATLRPSSAGWTPFQRRVLKLCAGVRSGDVVTYAELARRAGKPKAARAVGQVMARNPVPLLVPCHRVVGSDMSLRGYGGGLVMKKRLLENEGWQVRQGRLRKPS